MTIPAAKMTAGEWLRKGEEFLRARKVPEASASVEFIMGFVLGVGRGRVRAEASRMLKEKEGYHFWDLVKERGRRVPMGYILGTQPFRGLEIKVGRTVLIPRPETECLVECAVEVARKRFPQGVPLQIVDMGTGSGCILVALAVELPDAVLYGTEVSSAALRYADENVRAHDLEPRVRLLCEDFLKPAGRKAPWADIVVTNPPYIPTKDLPRLQPEVREEPAMALDGGKDGLRAIRAIAGQAPQMIKPGGYFLMEFGRSQAEKVEDILERNGFGEIEIRRDLDGLDRIAIARLP